jgi:hypothetical protein
MSYFNPACHSKYRNRHSINRLRSAGEGSTVGFMNGRLGVRHFVPLAALLLAVLVIPGTADAVLGGTNGRILFTSGRDSADGVDGQAKLFLRTTVGSFAAGDVGPAVTSTPGVQHRHATWSPDRTKIVYGRGTPGAFATEDFDIYIQDLTSPGSIPVPITTPGDSITADHPYWSPDGTRIAFDNEVTNGSGQRDISIYDISNGQTTNLTNTPAIIEQDPAWTPDSTELYYQTGDPGGVGTVDVVKRPAAGGAQVNIAAAPGITEMQPSVSPDGNNLCFVRGSGFNDTDDVIVSLTNGGGQTILTDDVEGQTKADYNCTWSPNGTQILFSRGTFTNGRLVMLKADGSDLFPIEITDDAMNFDGNADWAPDGSPVCDDVEVSTEINQPVEIEMTCRDTGPEYEKTNVQTTVSEPPTSGTLGDTVDGAEGTTVTDTVTYTPNAGFTGTDTYEFNSFDFRGFGQVRATATIEVKPEVITPPPPDTTAPTVTGITMKPKKWRRTARPKKSRTPIGTRIKFNLSETADVTLRFQKVLPGRKVGGKCVAPTAKRKKRPKCNRFVSVGRKTFDGLAAGANSVRSRGGLNSGRLKVGKFRLNVSAKDAAGNASKVVRGPVFRIVRR